MRPLRRSDSVGRIFLAVRLSGTTRSECGRLRPQQLPPLLRRPIFTVIQTDNRVPWMKACRPAGVSPKSMNANSERLVGPGAPYGYRPALRASILNDEHDIASILLLHGTFRDRDSAARNWSRFACLLEGHLHTHLRQDARFELIKTDTHFDRRFLP